MIRTSFADHPLGPLVPDGDFGEIVTSFADAPLLELPRSYKDGDDSLLKAGPLPHDPVRKGHLAGQPRALIVPHPRDLHKGMHGPDVTALQRALAAAHYRKWGTFTRFFGRYTRREVIAFQKDHGLKADGVYGLQTHKKLARFYDAYGIRLLHRVQTLSPTQRHQARLLAAATVAYNYGNRIHYSQGSQRMWMVRNHIHHEQIPQHAYIVEDCSSFATWLYWDAGVPDPNGLGYRGWGFTGTLSAHGWRIPFTNVPVGALYFYGYPPFRHVTISVGHGRCISQGGEYGPDLLSPFYQTPYTCHRYRGL